MKSRHARYCDERLSRALGLQQYRMHLLALVSIEEQLAALMFGNRFAPDQAIARIVGRFESART